MSIWGFTVDKQKNEALFNIDWSIYYQGKLIAFEGDKGHYLDICFLDRALVSYAKTINSYINNKKECSKFIIHRFTRYSKYYEKLEQFYDIINPKIMSIIKNNLVYTTLTSGDRLNKKKWFTLKK